MGKIHEFTVLSSQKVTPSTLVVTLHDNKRRLPFAYQPGQYAAFSYFHKGRPTPARCFSLTSSPTEQDFLQFAMRIAGAYTSTAAETLQPGARVIVEGPFGNFAFNNERDGSALLLAGGIGVTPFISMLRYAARLQLPNDMMLLYSCRTQDDIPFYDELNQITAYNPHLHVVYVIGSGPTDKLAGSAVIQGHIDGPLLDRITSKIYAGRTYFVCGPPGFMTGVSEALLKNGAPAEYVLTEAFAQGQRSPKSIRHNAPLQVYGLTGLSVALGMGTLLASDVAATAPALSASSNSSVQSTQSQLNSRQNTIAKTLSGLQNSGSNATTDTTTPDGTTTTPDQSSNSSTQVTVQGNSGGTSSPKSSSPTTSSGGTTSSGSGSSSSGSTSSGSSSGGTSSSGGSGSSSSGSGSGGTPTPTPPPPTPVAPVVTLSASSTSITSGDSVTLTWSVNSNATTPVTCTASGGWSGTKSTSGSTTVKPTSTTTYKLTCSNTPGSNAKSVTINVAPACVSTPSNPC